MVNISIDGVSMAVPENKNVLDCALEAGIYIPHLCHHPDLKDIGACRLCIVDVEGEQEALTSCTMKAREGLKITTDSDRLRKLRNLALELILAGHPEECTTCPKYGMCELQSLIQYIGANNARMKHRSKGFKVEEENPLILHDMNRCVLCGRCVRACHELRGVKVLSYQKKELEYYVGTVHNKLLTESDCRFCNACTEVCPTGAIRDKVPASMASRNKEDVQVPCRYACPAHTDIPSYIRYAKEGKYDEATAVIREKLPIPKILGYICNHVCELDCKRNELGDPLSIREIKRYSAEADTGSYWKGKGKQLPDTNKRVCVVGSGPAGLSAAYYLRKQGHQVTVKEALPELGGMMRYGIPSYRLPREILDEEVGLLLESGIHIETRTKIEDPNELSQEYDAVLMAIGAHKGIKLPIEGNDLEGVLVNIDFLRTAAMKEETGIGEKVVVLGGGNVAFDCARTAIRLGAKEVSLACLENEDQIPADQEEIDHAQVEGIRIYFGRTFEKITGMKQVTGVEFCEVESFTFDENRRPLIEKKADSKHFLEADTVIFAVGQRPEFNVLSETENIFSAGDAVYGTNSVVKAVASGRDAASKIDRFLGGDGDISEKFAPEKVTDPYIGCVKGFASLNRESSADGICNEASRCLQCDLRLEISKPKLWSDFTERKEV